MTKNKHILIFKFSFRTAFKQIKIALNNNYFFKIKNWKKHNNYNSKAKKKKYNILTITQQK